MKKVWKTKIDGSECEIILDIGWDTRRVVTVDGKKIIDDTPYSNMGSKYKFAIGSHSCVLLISRSYFKWKTEYSFTVDEEKINSIS